MVVLASAVTPVRHYLNTLCFTSRPGGAIHNCLEQLILCSVYVGSQVKECAADIQVQGYFLCGSDLDLGFNDMAILQIGADQVASPSAPVAPCIQENPKTGNGIRTNLTQCCFTWPHVLKDAFLVGAEPLCGLVAY